MTSALGSEWPSALLSQVSSVGTSSSGFHPYDMHWKQPHCGQLPPRMRTM